MLLKIEAVPVYLWKLFKGEFVKKSPKFLGI